jgi:hypothetical protein
VAGLADVAADLDVYEARFGEAISAYLITTAQVPRGVQALLLDACLEGYLPERRLTDVCETEPAVRPAVAELLLRAWTLNAQRQVLRSIEDPRRLSREQAERAEYTKSVAGYRTALDADSRAEVMAFLANFLCCSMWRPESEPRLEDAVRYLGRQETAQQQRARELRAQGATEWPDGLEAAYMQEQSEYPYLRRSGIRSREAELWRSLAARWRTAGVPTRRRR